jgi:imidazoleglycerol-phosphate dehydratase
MRTATVTRTTRETDITIELNLDGSGTASARTGLPFFDHMLEALGKHARCDLTIVARGDLEVDPHHTVEDTGIVLGQALARALGEKASIRRFGSAIVPMDEALALAALDISGRPHLSFTADIGDELIGTFKTDLVEEFFTAFVNAAGLTLHIQLLAGKNAHHKVEAIFKAVAQALANAIAIDDRIAGVPSTKGVLE